MGASAHLALPIIFTILFRGVTSRDIEVFVNDSLSMRCSPNELTDIQWQHNSDINYVYAGGKLRPPYNSRFLLKKDEKTGDYDLIIPKVTLEDAGRYYCSKEIDGRPINSTQLTVLYMKPACSSNMPTDGFIGPNTCNIQQENMMFICDVIFNGSAPHLSWRSANHSQVFNSSSCEVKSSRISCSLTLKADPSYDGSVFICDVGHMKLDDLRYSCNTDMIKVHYLFGDYAYEKKYVHETANCEVRSNLNVRYNWILKQNNEEIFLASKQTVSIEKPGLHQCEVKYSIINVTCSLLVSVVNATEYIDQKEQSTILLAVILPIAIVVLVIALIGSIIYNKKQTRDNRLKMEDMWEIGLLTILIEINFGLLNKLLRYGALTNAIKETIENKPTPFEKNDLLLKHIFSENKHQDLMKALSDCGQNRVVNLVKANGVIVPVHVTLECENLDDVETRIVNQMAQLVADRMTNVSEEQRQRLSLIAAMQLNLIAFKRGKSIVSYISCSKEEEFIHLCKIIESLKMRNILEQLFNQLIPNAKIEVILVNISSEDMEKAQKIFKGSKLKCMECSVPTAYARELPCKHVICPDCVQVLVEDNARNYGIECPSCKSPFTVTVVPQDRIQQEQNKYVRDEYNVEIKEDRSSLCLESKVMGMAIMDNNIFVVCKKSTNIIFRYDLDVCGGKETVPVELSISDMVWPNGMAASENHSCLYITDWSETSGGKLWRYKYKRGEEARVNGPVADLDVRPFGVSVSPKNDEVLVTCGTPGKVPQENRGWIYIYKQSGDEFPKIRTIDFPQLEIPRHAILTASSQFIVCHGSLPAVRHGVTSFEDGEDGVLVAKLFYGRVSGGGGAGESEMNRPLSLTIDRNRMILVVDYNNSRIQLLTEDLQLVRHLLTKEKHRIEYPRHVCQDPSTGRLYVGQEDGKVHIFN